MDMPQQYNWTDEDTERLITWRRENEDAVRGFETFIKDHGLEGKVEAPFVKKKWENLKQKYKELKAPRTGVRTEGGEPTAASWKWFGAMDEVSGDRPSITSPVLITSSASPPSPPSQASTSGVSWGKHDGWVTLFRELDERKARAEERADRREREAQEREEKMESERREDEIRSMERREREWREWMDARRRDERRERERSETERVGRGRRS